MKWLVLLTLLALAVVATHAESGHFVDGVEYVDSAEELPHSGLEELYSFIDQELGQEEAYEQFALIDTDADADAEGELEGELEAYSEEDFQQALAFISADQELTKGFKSKLKKLGGKIKKGIKKAVNKVKGKALDAAAQQFVKLGKKGFSKLPKKLQDLVRKMVQDAKAPKKKDNKKKKAQKKKQKKPKAFVPTVKTPMDPFAAKHYKKGFVPGRLGRPQLLPYQTPAGHETLRLVEDCMSCRFVWQSVEMDVGNINAQKTVYDSFVSHCRRGMNAPVMYQPCQMMFGHLDDMVTGYTSGLSVDEICAQARLCR